MHATVEFPFTWVAFEGWRSPHSDSREVNVWLGFIEIYSFSSTLSPSSVFLLSESLSTYV